MTLTLKPRIEKPGSTNQALSSTPARTVDVSGRLESAKRIPRGRRRMKNHPEHRRLAEFSSTAPTAKRTEEADTSSERDG